MFKAGSREIVCCTACRKRESVLHSRQLGDCILYSRQQGDSVLYSRQKEGKCTAQQAGGGIVYSTAGSKETVCCTAGRKRESLLHSRQKGG